MNTYNYKSIVSNTEAEALKEMIYKRAKERAKLLTEETQVSYTSAVHDDIMNLARNSFVANKNPFAMVHEEPKLPVKPEEKVEKIESENTIGFPTRKQLEHKDIINSSFNHTKEQIVQAEIQATMSAASKDLYKKQGFVGALAFLNSQATISLIKNKGKNFEAIV